LNKDQLACPVCKSEAFLLDVVDFNKSCNEAAGNLFTKKGLPIYYSFCDNCGFCWTPEIHSWEFSRFNELIYNDEYVKIDPDYVELRPKQNANFLRSTFPSIPSGVRHLDFGGGNGLLSKLLRSSNWDSHSYDPFVDTHIVPDSLGKFDLITAFEVFEHVSDIPKLITGMMDLLSENGVILFTTLLSDGNIQLKQRLSWWYASPRNGHISLFSKKSLSVLAENYGFCFGNFNNSLHMFFKTMPSWAAHLIR
jgi:SAM-dependent methyltransferase